MQPDLLLSIPPALSTQLKRQTDEALSAVVRTNYSTQFAQAASELTEFRQATTGLISGMDNGSISDVFRNTVHFTTQSAYAPFVAKFLDKPCKANSVANLLAPGLPDYLVRSSGTSGHAQKFFPKYNCLPATTEASSVADWRNISDPNRTRVTLRLRYLWSNQMDVEDDENCLVKRIYICSLSVMRLRNDLNLSLEYDEEKMGTFILDHAVPYAAGFIKKWRSFLLIHVLFALTSRSLDNISMGYITTFVHMMYHLDVEFDVVVDSIKNGTIPSLDGIEEVRHHLESNISPDPERAAELRSLGRPSASSGWCGHVWPNLRSVICIASGSFAFYLPSAKWYLGPNVDICSSHYGSSEASMIALTHNPREENLYKFTKRHILEFLDIEKSNDSISSLSQLWEVKVEKRYEIVVTNPDGLWRYRLGDVIEIVGFDRTDGIPIMKFIERRNVVMRIYNSMFTEKELRDMFSSFFSSMPFIRVLNWTTTIDDRQMPSTIGFFVELAGDEVSDPVSSASDRLLDALLRTKPYLAPSLAIGFFRKPTIRLVRLGTFSDFLQLKLDEGSKNLGQIKVPVMLPKAEYVAWFSNRVVLEL